MLRRLNQIDSGHKQLMKERFLAGDIGGTKTDLALFSPRAGPYQLLEQATYPSNDFNSLEDMLHSFLADKSLEIVGARFGVAGPVLAGRSQVTNLRWTVEEASLSQAIGGAPVRLLNDLFAIANGIPYLQPADLDTLIPGQPEEGGPLGVIAPGTGLGEAFLIWNGRRYQPCPSEGGHASFGPETPLELELLNYLWPRFGHVSFERVCSGIGMVNLYTFLRDGKGYHEPEWLRQRLVEASDPNPVITRAAIENKAEICAKTLDLFISIMGSEAGNLALKVMATGGIYLGGGIPPHILPQLKKKTFRNAFTNKGRFAGMLMKVPVYVILHKQAALFGAACHGLEPG